MSPDEVGQVDILTLRGALGDRIAFSLTPVSPRLSKGKKAFRARVRTRGTFDTVDIAEEMARRGAVNDGTFGSVDDEFDPKRHKVLPTVCTTKAFKAAVAAAEVVNVSKPLKAKVFSLMDSVTKSLNAFTGRHVVCMQGDNLGICTDNPDEGVFLVTKGKTVAVAEVLKSDAQIIDCRFNDPPPPGKYDLIVRCRNGSDPSFAPAETTLRGIIVKGE